jgi:short-subunit dehydrogenase
VTDLAGLTAVLTGATGGIGRSIALALGRRSVNLHLLVRDRTRAEALGSELAAAAPGIDTRFHDADLSKDISVAANRILRERGPVDILIHSAGSIALKSVADTSEADLEAQYRVNVSAPYSLTRLLLPRLQQRRGQIVFVNSSVAHQKARAELLAYTASKYALMAVADGLRDEVNRHGIRVLSVYPGRTATVMQQRLFAYEKREYQEDGLLKPGDVAQAIVAALEMPRSAETTDIFLRPFKKH